MVPLSPHRAQEGKLQSPVFILSINSMQPNFQIFIVGQKTTDLPPEHHARELQPCLANSIPQYLDS